MDFIWNTSLKNVQVQFHTQKMPKKSLNRTKREKWAKHSRVPIDTCIVPIDTWQVPIGTSTVLIGTSTMSIGIGSKSGPEIFRSS